MGLEERAAMFLQLENTNRELNELNWKLQQISNEVLGLWQQISGGKIDGAIETLEKPTVPIVPSELLVLLQKIKKLGEQKAFLEKSLGVKLTME